MSAIWKTAVKLSRGQSTRCVFGFITHKHLNTLAHSGFDVDTGSSFPHSLSLALSTEVFFSLLQVPEASCPPLGHHFPWPPLCLVTPPHLPMPGDLSKPLTASGAQLDWIYMICPSIKKSEDARVRERNRSPCVKSGMET